MHNDNDLNLHSITKLSGWLRYRFLCTLRYLTEYRRFKHCSQVWLSFGVNFSTLKIQFGLFQIPRLSLFSCYNLAFLIAWQPLGLVSNENWVIVSFLQGAIVKSGKVSKLYGRWRKEDYFPRFFSALNSLN